MEEQEPVTCTELPTPARESVFSRLYAGRKLDVKTKSQTLRAGAEKGATNKSKGRPVPSKFSGSSGITKKVESQRQHLGRRFSFKTPGTNVFQRSKPKPSTKQPDRVPPSVKLARSKLQSANYWFSLVNVAEKAENHNVAVGLFRLAISCSAEPTSEIRKAYAAYRARYKLDHLTESSQEVLDVEVGGDGEPDLSKVCNVEVHVNSSHADESFDEVEVICDDGGVMPSAVIENKKDESVKNLFEEVYSRIPTEADIKCEQSGGNHSVSEIINMEDLPEVTSPSKPLERLATPRHRSTPLRASAIRAAQKIEESAKKQFRRKHSEHKTTSTTAAATGLAVEKMDVNSLMKEVVGMIAGSSDEAQSAAEEPAKAVADSPNKASKTADSKNKRSGKKPSKAPASNEQVKVANESSVNGISEKENVFNGGATDEERNEPIKVAPSPGEAKRTGRPRPTPKKSNKAPFL